MKLVLRIVVLWVVEWVVSGPTLDSWNISPGAVVGDASETGQTVV